MRLPGRLLAQVAVSALLLALLVRRVPVHSALVALGRARPGTLAASLTLSLCGYWGRARRWSVLLERAGVELTLWRSFQLTLVGTFYGSVTPGRVGEFARVLHLPLPRSRTLPSVVWDRVADVVLLELMALPAFVLVPAWRGVLLPIYVGMVVVTATGIALLAHEGFAAGMARVLPLARPHLERWSRSSDGTLTSTAFVRSLGYGLFFYVFVYAAGWLLLRDLAPGASARLVLGFPVIPLLGNLPIAFGGLGLREQVSATMFGRLGEGAAEGAAFSLLWFLTATLLPGLCGLLLSPWRGSGAPRARGDEA